MLQFKIYEVEYPLIFAFGFLLFGGSASYDDHINARMVKGYYWQMYVHICMCPVRNICIYPYVSIGGTSSFITYNSMQYAIYELGMQYKRASKQASKS